MSNYQLVIGLEIHVELATKSKMFCRCSADYFNKEPNTHVCPVCLGLPGAMPVPNKQAIEWTMLIGKALNCTLNKVSKFDRKHYFYPDLPKGYQISQYDEPLCANGVVILRGAEDLATKGSVKNALLDSSRAKLGQNDKKFRIHRVHLEEDTGKLIHKGTETLVDFNRSGVPLVEIVTEPDFDNAEDVKKFLEELQIIIRYLGVSAADMEKGSMRLEPNISVKKSQKAKVKRQNEREELPKYKVEVKNINSFNFVKRAIEYEVKRHIEILEKGETPVQETRGYNEDKGITVGQRSKEGAHDYRYFPEPDIPPLQFTDEELEKIASQLPELPQQKFEKFSKIYAIKPSDAFLLTRDQKVAKYYEEVSLKFKVQSAKLQLKIENYGQQIVNLIINKRISTDISVEEFVRKAIDLLSPKKTDIGVLDQVIEKVLKQNGKAVEDYKNGKQSILMFLVGQVMREMKGRADANKVKEEIVSKIK